MLLNTPISKSVVLGGSTILTTIGALYAWSILRRLGVFIWTHYIHRSTIARYRKTTSGKPAWALVTGASDGVGQGFVEALADRGFNVVLHGRNEQKLRALIEHLRERFPDRQFDVLLLDGLARTRGEQKMEYAVQSLRGREIKVLINNLGGHGGSGNWLALVPEQSAETVDAWIDLTARFPAQFTRMLLPQLMQNQPALIQNIGSASADMPSPWLALYSACKAFNKSYSQSLQLEVIAQGCDIEVQHIMAANIATQRSKRVESWSEPSPRMFAQSALATVGCGSKVVWGYAAQAPLLCLINSFADWIRDRLIIKEMSRVVANEQTPNK